MDEVANLNPMKNDSDARKNEQSLALRRFATMPFALSVLNGVKSWMHGAYRQIDLFQNLVGIYQMPQNPLIPRSKIVLGVRPATGVHRAQ